jgi:hypothetical protein
MAHTCTNLLTHMIFSTKDRKPLITRALHDDLLPYIGGIRRMTFQEELIAFLKKNGIAHDERYLWS